MKPVQDQFYGDRNGFIQDPFGHLWGIATHVEDVSPAGDERADEKDDAGGVVRFELEAGQLCSAFTSLWPLKLFACRDLANEKKGLGILSFATEFE